MISQHQIARLIEAKEYKQLVTRVLTNGRCRSTAVRQLLTQPEIARIAAIGLGLQRLTELSYGPCQQADRLADELLASQRADGVFGVLDDSSQSESRGPLMAATSIAMRALVTSASQQTSMRTGVDSTAGDAIDRAITALRQEFDNAGGIGLDGTAWAVVLWQLGDVSVFRARFPVEALVSALIDAGEDVDDELCRYALAVAA